MGVDFYNCDICNDIYADCGPCGSCEGCGQSWCGNYDDDMKIFVVGDKACCDLCYVTDPLEITIKDDEILAFALEKLGKTRKELIAEMDLSDRLKPAQCSECAKKQCDRLEETWDDPTRHEDHHDRRKFVCCSCRRDDPEWEEEFDGDPCKDCKKKKMKRV